MADKPSPPDLHLRMAYGDPAMQPFIWQCANPAKINAAACDLILKMLALHGFKPVEISLSIVETRWDSIRAYADRGGNEVWIDRRFLKLVSWRRTGQEGTFLIPEKFALEKGLM